MHQSAVIYDFASRARAIRAARANVKLHLKYTNWLAGTRHWLAGPRITYADLAAAAAISVLDYLGEIDWRDHGAAREWYTRLKSRPVTPAMADFRSWLLATHAAEGSTSGAVG